MYSVEFNQVSLMISLKSVEHRSSLTMQIGIGSFTLTITGALVFGIVGLAYVSYLFYSLNSAISYLILLIFIPIFLLLLAYFIYSMVEREKERPAWL
jgi:phosphate/sulfate permease